MPRAVLLALISLALLVAGCGGSSASGGDDPASAVPAGAAFYLEGTVRPEGDLRDDALAAAGKVLRTDDPQAKIDELVAKAFAESEDPKVDYKKDIAPWLGEKVALWGAVPANAEEDFRGALVATVEDEDEAQSALDRSIEGSDETFRKRTYKDVDYQASTDSAVGLVEGFAVFGTEPEFKKTVDAVKGDGLESDKRFQKALDGLEDDRLGTFYVDAKSLYDAAIRQDPEAAQQLEQAKRSVRLREDRSRRRRVLGRRRPARRRRDRADTRRRLPRRARRAGQRRVHAAARGAARGLVGGLRDARLRGDPESAL